MTEAMAKPRKRGVVLPLGEAVQQVAVGEGRIVSEEHDPAKMLDKAVVWTNRHETPEEIGSYKVFLVRRGTDTLFSDFSPPLLSPKDFIYLQTSLNTPQPFSPRL